MRTRMAWGLIGLGLGVGAALAASPELATQRLQQSYPGVQVLVENDRVTRVYGNIFGVGQSPEEVAESFVQGYSEVLGSPAGDLLPGSARNGVYTQPVMYEPETGTYKFTLVYYRQSREGLPVYEADVRLLVLNQADHPLVLAASSLRDLGDYRVPVGLQDRLAVSAATEAALADEPALSDFGDAELVIWAGRDDDRATPTAALSFVASGTTLDGRPLKYRFVADAQTGAILYREDLIRFTNVTGSVQGMATVGAKADYCSPEEPMAMPWARVQISGGSAVYADGAGNFTIPNSGTTPVTVQSFMYGTYFTVDNYQGAEETLSLSVTPPGPANFMHNQANTEEFVRAQVNAYVSANKVRDWVLAQNPTYPTISTETAFPIYVNRTDGYCPGNAWSDGTSINFCSSSANYPNTAWQSVLNHEYGHHVIDQGGSGQGAYGEGMSDCHSMLPVDDPGLGYGFYLGQCDVGLRNANNNYQYPCTGEIHDCGQLLSGCVWSTRNELIVTEPVNYLSILSRLTVNSILLHSGDQITPQITIDYLTLDDTDGNIGNGTPHYPEICAGFGAHNMDCPPLQVGLSVSPTDGFLSEGPGGGPFTPASKVYTVENRGPGAMQYSVTSPAAWLTITNGTGTIPTVGGTVQVTVAINAAANGLPDGGYHETVSFVNLTDHVGDTTRAVTLNVGIPQVVYDWPMDTNPGWTTAGQWAFGHPTGGGSYNGDPTNGHTGINVYGYNLNGDYPNNLPATYLTTPPIDCTGLGNTTLRFWRWLGVESNSNYDEATVEVSRDGSTWTVIWRATSTGAAVSDSSWQLQEFSIGAIADNQPTVYIRWGMGPTDVGVTYPGWNIDDVQIIALGGESPAINILLPDGTPEYVDPGLPTTFRVQIVDGSEQYVPGTGLLRYRFSGGAFQTVPLVQQSGNMYLATLPGALCADTPEFYLSAQGDGGSTVLNPAAAPMITFETTVGVLTTLRADDFEVDTGWTVGDTGDNATNGIWDRDVPQATAAQPGEDHTPSPGTRCWVTDHRAGSSLGDYDVDGGKTTIKSPTLNLSGYANANISYYRWYSNDTGGGPNADVFVVDISNNNGTTWVNVETVGPSGSGTSGGWFFHQFDVADFVTPTGQVRLRFVASDYNTPSLVEAALDDFQVVAFTCVNPTTYTLSVTASGQGTVALDPPGGTYPAGATVQLTAQEAAGWRFDHWEGALGGSTNPASLVMNGPKSVAAVFLPQVCHGDCNCDHAVGFTDIDLFVAAIPNNQANWAAKYEFYYGSPPPAGCWANCDVNGNGNVGFDDIDVFVALIPSACAP